MQRLSRKQTAVAADLLALAALAGIIAGCWQLHAAAGFAALGGVFLLAARWVWERARS